MKPLRTRLREAALRMRVSQMVVEKDYALSYLLAGIAANPDLSGTLIFKGGTALKKLYFGDYRFSEDLDFSAVDAPRGQALEEAVRAYQRPERADCAGGRLQPVPHGRSKASPLATTSARQDALWSFRSHSRGDGPDTVCFAQRRQLGGRRAADEGADSLCPRPDHPSQSRGARSLFL